jgi:hypothetical protein
MRSLHSPCRLLQLTGLVLSLVITGCGGKGPTAPDGSLFPSGTWAGTMTRPGRAPIPAVWVATRTPGDGAGSSGGFTGPLTLTTESGSLTLLLSGNLGGSNTAPGGYRFNASISLEAGAAAAFPNCRITSTGSDAQKDLYDNSMTITTPPFQLSYFNCQGLVPAGPSNFTVETGVLLTLTKQ